jgi:hypothetical protein
MPQLDLVPYAAQFVWLTLILGTYYVFCVHSLLPTLSALLKTRAAREVEVQASTFAHPSEWSAKATLAYTSGLVSLLVRRILYTRKSYKACKHAILSASQTEFRAQKGKSLKRRFSPYYWYLTHMENLVAGAANSSVAFWGPKDVNLSANPYLSDPTGLYTGMVYDQPLSNNPHLKSKKAGRTGADYLETWFAAHLRNQTKGMAHAAQAQLKTKASKAKPKGKAKRIA